MSKQNISSDKKGKKKPIHKRLKKFFKRENIVKIVIIGATLALVLTSILPYILL